MSNFWGAYHTGSLDLDAYSDVIHVQAGSFTQTGADIDIYVKYRRGIQTSGTLNMEGGTLFLSAGNCHHIYSNGGVNVSGGSIETSGAANQIIAYGTGFKMTDGTLIINGKQDLLRTYAGTCSIEGGTVQIDGTTNLILTQEGISVTISGGTLNLTSTSGNCINSGANITISQADEDVPTVVTMNAKTFALRLNKSNRTCSILGGTVTGAGTHFVFTNTKSTIHVGTDAVIDYNCTTKPFTDGDDSYTVTLNTNGVIWEDGKELTDASVPTHIQTKVSFDPIKVDLDATVKLTDKTLNEKDFEFVLMSGENVLQTVKNDANGNITFAPIEYTEAGVYTYTVKQVKGDMAGVTYDETAYTVTVTVVNENGTLVATVDTIPAFKNIYRVPFLDGKIENGKYVVNGVPTEMGLIEIDGAYYYVGPNGVLVTNQDYYAWQLNEQCDKAKAWYTFDKDGKMVISGLYNGRYYVNAIPTEVGLFLNAEDGKYYCAGPNGKIVKDADYYVWMIDDSAKDMKTGWYKFDENGKMIIK